MHDVVEMIRSGVRKEDAQREQIRRHFPVCAAIVDEFRIAFGPGVKPLYFSENGKTMGKQRPFEGIDIDKLIRLDESDNERIRKLRSGK